VLVEGPVGGWPVVKSRRVEGRGWVRCDDIPGWTG
jgi:hypothetical protein